ncbi:flagellar filament capping protein FliD [Psychrobacillus vulpis]|uniref:Flagellar hook-associated protein 2 n=1 Tax=Psychrobacillus vulpis TaxID=2325572 RepID=A0A544TIW6_9BACI|nr:flagellar filament capping protein FliD [Psychrobacillus vulpis]TQR17385.1 flagellar hook protein FliD [Psychrobacillus vulpis]
MRLSGLASGMDTETIIKDLMKAERMPLTKITQKKQTLQWQLDSYRAVNRKLQEFSQKTFDNIIMSNSFRAKKMEISAPNDVSISNKNSTSDFTGTIKVDQLAKNSTMHGSEITGAVGQSANKTLTELGITGTEITIDAIDENGVIKPGKMLTFASTDKLSDVLNKINKETGVNAFFDSKTGKIAMTTKLGGATGNNDEIQVSGDLGASLGLNGQPVTSGQNAIFSINGLEMERSTNTFEVNGFEFTLKEANSKEINFASKPDTEAVLETVVKFVDDYNKLMEELNGLVRESKYRSFQPLSTEEKAAMSEKEIELWEEKAKSGLLRNDPMISGMVTKMRSALMGSVEGLGSLKEIGIGSTTGKYAWQDNGKLVINEDKLKEAINADPDKVHKLFAQTGDPANPTKPGEIVGEQGFAQRLKALTDITIKEISKRAGSAGSTNASFTMGRSLDEMNKQMDRYEDRMKKVEDRYWRQFNAMENAIQRANAQSAQLMNSLGGGA